MATVTADPTWKGIARFYGRLCDNPLDSQRVLDKVGEEKKQLATIAQVMLKHKSNKAVSRPPLEEDLRDLIAKENAYFQVKEKQILATKGWIRKKYLQLLKSKKSLFSPSVIKNNVRFAATYNTKTTLNYFFHKDIRDLNKVERCTIGIENEKSFSDIKKIFDSIDNPKIKSEFRGMLNRLIRQHNCYKKNV